MSNEQQSTSGLPATQKRSFVLDRHLRKTKICAFYQKGTCFRGSTCEFAHGKSELHEMPVFYKTRICPNLGACSNKMCAYAHTQEELRVADISFKTSICRWHASGICRNGETCRFAHGIEELRSIHADSKEEGKAASKGNKAKKNATSKVTQLPDDYLMAESSNVRAIKSKLRAARHAAVNANQMIDAHNTEEESMTPVAWKTWSNHPMFIQLDDNKNYMSDWELLAKVHSDLSKEQGDPDEEAYHIPKDLPCWEEAGLLNPPSSPALDQSVGLCKPIEFREPHDADKIQQTPPVSADTISMKTISMLGSEIASHELYDIAFQLHKSTSQKPQNGPNGHHPTDFDIIPHIRSFEQGNGSQEGISTSQDVSYLAQTIKDLTYEVDALQRHFLQQHASCQNAAQDIQGYSDSTKSSSGFNYSSNGSSSGSSSRSHQEKLMLQL